MGTCQLSFFFFICLLFYFYFCQYYKKTFLPFFPHSLSLLFSFSVHKLWICTVFIEYKVCFLFCFLPFHTYMLAQKTNLNFKCGTLNVYLGSNNEFPVLPSSIDIYLRSTFENI